MLLEESDAITMFKRHYALSSVSTTKKNMVLMWVNGISVNGGKS